MSTRVHRLNGISGKKKKIIDCHSINIGPAMKVQPGEQQLTQTQIKEAKQGRVCHHISADLTNFCEFSSSIDDDWVDIDDEQQMAFLCFLWHMLSDERNNPISQSIRVDVDLIVCHWGKKSTKYKEMIILAKRLALLISSSKGNSHHQQNFMCDSGNETCQSLVCCVCVCVVRMFYIRVSEQQSTQRREQFCDNDKNRTTATMPQQ